jgi:type I restriction enzyme S subunit
MVAPLFGATPTGACAAYTNLRNATSGHALEAREHCEDLWRDYEPLADSTFLAEFPRRLHERWFEMYLTVALLRAGLNVQCPKPGPDVLLTIDGRRVWIEATCATGGATGLPDSIPEPYYANVAAGEQVVARSVPIDAITLRIRNSLHTKEQVFRSYVEQGIVDAGDVAVVAINVHAVPYAWADMEDLMRRTLYGLGHLTLTLNRDTMDVIARGYQERPTIPKIATGAAVGVDPFVTGAMPHISAVLGSREDAANRPPRLGDGLALFPNVTATNTWPAGAIKLGQEWLVKQVEDGADLERVSYIPSAE